MTNDKAQRYRVLDYIFYPNTTGRSGITSLVNAEYFYNGMQLC